LDVAEVAAFLGPQLDQILAAFKGPAAEELGPLAAYFARADAAAEELGGAAGSLLELWGTRGDGFVIPAGLFDDPLRHGFVAHGTDVEEFAEVLGEFFASTFTAIGGLESRGESGAEGKRRFGVHLDAAKLIENLESENPRRIDWFVEEYGDTWELALDSDGELTRFYLEGEGDPGAGPAGGLDPVAEQLGACYPFIALRMDQRDFVASAFEEVLLPEPVASWVAALSSSVLPGGLGIGIESERAVLGIWIDMESIREVLETEGL
jgi:hypothetical protein